MSTDLSLYGVDQDYGSGLTPAFAPTSGRVGQAAAASQGGRVVLFVGSTGLLQAAALDVSGNLKVVPTSASGASLVVAGGGTPPALTSQSGYLQFGRQDIPTPAAYQPLTLDPQGALMSHPRSKPSFRGGIAQVVSAQNKVLLSVMNGSTSVVRVTDVSLYIAQQSVNGAILGSTGFVYYPVYCQMHRITGHTLGTGGSSVTLVQCDSGDTLATGITVYSNSTVTGQATAFFHRADANDISPANAWYARPEPNAKTLCLRPSEGMAVVCVSTGQVVNSGGTGTITASIDVELGITQCSG